MGTSYHRGDMDIHEQRSTYDFFMGLTKWGSLAVAVLVTVLTVWFCAGAGFVNAAVVGAILLVAGVWILRKRERGELGAP